MKIVIIGVGKIGLTLAEYLSQEDHDVTVIDTDPKVIDEAINSFDVMGILGNGVNFDIQREAGVEHADIVIATASSDEINMLCCLIAKKIGNANTIARIRDPEYSKQFSFMLGEMGLDMIVNPEYEAAVEISRGLRFPSAIKIDTFAKDRVDLAELKITPDSPLDGQVVFELQKKLGARLLVCAVQRGEKVFIPGGNFVLCAGDKIHFTSSHTELDSFFKAIGVYQQKLKNIMIIGGGRIAYYLAVQLIEIGMSVKIIEHDEKHCLELNELLPKKVKIICGDGTDQEVLKEENIDGSDAVVAITGIDEENIIISMYASKHHVPKIITKINKSSLNDMLSSVGIDSVITPRQITANRIISYIRALQNSGGSNIQTLYKLVGNEVEALEFYARESSRTIGKALKDLKLKKNLLVCCIIRAHRIIIPGGNDTIKAGDNVIIVTTNEKLNDLDDILI